MLSTAQLIPYLYPSAIDRTDFEMRDNGEGPYLASWNTAKLGPQPTISEIEVRRGEVPDPPLAERSEATIAAELSGALTNLRSYITNPNPTAAQDRQALKLVARMCVYLTRRSLKDYSGTD